MFNKTPLLLALDNIIAKAEKVAPALLPDLHQFRHDLNNAANREQIVQVVLLIMKFLMNGHHPSD